VIRRAVCVERAVLQSQLVVSWVAVVSFGLVWGFLFFCLWMDVCVVGESAARGRKAVAGFSLLFLRLWKESICVRVRM